MSKIVERIERELGIEGLAGLLAEQLAPTDLQSLLLEVYRRRSARRSPAEILASYKSDHFVRPSSISPERLLAWEQTAFSVLPAEFQALELSPLCPLGTSSVIAGVSQDWAVTTARNTEVVSDSTNVLALECALRRRKLLRDDPKSVAPAHLAASQRLLRAQRFHGPNQVTHFSLLALCSAGRNQGGMEFEASIFRLHIQFYLKALRKYLGEDVQLRVAVTDFSGRVEAGWMEAHLLAPFRDEKVECNLEETRIAGKGYYPGLCFHIYAVEPSGNYLELADGGEVDWTQRLLGSAKERLVISGIAGERVCSGF